MQFGIPVSGTAAHSWTMAFADEEDAFRKLQNLLGPFTVFLIDTYDTLEGARLVARLGGPMTGVRLDSGDLEVLSRQVRTILDSAGLHNTRIMATNDLDEYRLAELVGAGAPIDSFGVGTQLATSGDAPSLPAVYKLVELESDGVVQYTAKYSEEKNTTPGAKQIFRAADGDTIAHSTECPGEMSGQPLLRPVIAGGELVEALPTISRAREYALRSLAALPSSLRSLTQPAPYPVKLSNRLRDLTNSVKTQRQHHVHP
jgi:nicotinate phosphoribosyltransferase